MSKDFFFFLGNIRLHSDQQAIFMTFKAMYIFIVILMKADTVLDTILECSIRIGKHRTNISVQYVSDTETSFTLKCLCLIVFTHLSWYFHFYYAYFLIGLGSKWFCFCFVTTCSSDPKFRPKIVKLTYLSGQDLFGFIKNFAKVLGLSGQVLICIDPYVTHL